MADVRPVYVDREVDVALLSTASERGEEEIKDE